MPLLPIHIAAGAIALVAGGIALYSAKGANLHRKSGLIFVAAMIVMAVSGALMAILLNPNRINVIAGGLTFYLVSTGLLTVRRKMVGIRALDIGALLLGLAVGTAAISFGFMAAGSERGRLDGMPSAGYFVFGTVALLAVFGDLRMILARGIRGAPRITRHLWRMCVALFIATASFFLGQADEFPQAIRSSGVLSIPVLAVVLTTLYWLVHVRFTKWYQRVYKGISSNTSAARPAETERQVSAQAK